jgi:thiamine biosynthesis lipoprotein
MRSASFEHERAFDLFGSRVRLLIGPPVDAGVRPPELAAVALEAFLRRVHARLSRFDPASELCALNADPGDSRAVSPLLALAVRAGLWAAEITGGLADPTLVGALERTGYAHSRAGLEPAPLNEALRIAPLRRPAAPRVPALWTRVSVDGRRRIVRRPAGVRLDTGGTGKGLAADLCASRLGGYATFAVDAGGDVRLGGDRPVPRVVEIEHPLGDRPAATFELAAGAIATSGISTRLWRDGTGFAHHLLDPASGRPAWTGVIQATALAETALEAEAVAKAALLAGPERGRTLLACMGGVLVLDGGEVVEAGAFGARTERRAA